MSELKPCPFCGGTDIYETYSQEYSLGTKNPEIFCNTCKSIFSVEDDSPYMNCDEDFKYRKEKTRKAWNRRAPKTGQWLVSTDGRLHCSNCDRVPVNRIMFDGSLIYDTTPIRETMKFCPACGASMSTQTDSERGINGNK